MKEVKMERGSSNKYSCQGHISIPQQLASYKFCLLHGKKPFEEGWQSKPYNLEDPEFQNWIREEKNYGVMGGYGNLIILDFDDKAIRHEMLKDLPLTFQVMTGSGGLHHYYLTDNPESLAVDYQGHRAIDVQGRGKQVVGPGSIHPNGNRYRIALDFEITFLPQSDLFRIIKDTLPQDSWPARLRPNRGNGQQLPDVGSGKIDRESIVQILTPYWAKDNGKHNNFSLAIAGMIRRAGGTLEDAEYVLSKLYENTGKGYGFHRKARYVFQMKDGSRFFGLTKVREIMQEVHP